MTFYFSQNFIIQCSTSILLSVHLALTMSTAVIVENYDNGVVKITLNRPQALNSINHELLDGLTNVLRDASKARVIVLEGTGDRSFCAGEDLKQSLVRQPGTPQDLNKAFEQLQDITRLTASAKSVVIAAVQGFAIGGGAEIALAADFVIGGPGVKYRFPEATIGLAVTGGISARLPHLVGLLKAKELLITGRFVEADEALKLGLLTEVVDDPKTRAMELASQLAAMPSEALFASKISLERATFPNMEDCLGHEISAATHCFAQADADQALEGFAARKNNVPSLRTINEVWQKAVEDNPRHVFFRFNDKDLTYQQFDNNVARLAGGLRAAGISKSDRVLVMMRNSPEMVATWLAANRLGATWVPINTEIKSVTLQDVVKAAGPAAIIVDDELWPSLEASTATSAQPIFIHSTSTKSYVSGLKNLSELLETGSTVDTPVTVDPGDTAAFLYTSGTTGKSKPCVIPHEYFLLQAEALIVNYGLLRDDVLYCPFPLFHVDATALTVMPAILMGATAALAVRYSASKFWDDIRETRATVYNYMGATLALTYKQPPRDDDRNHCVRLAWGVPLPSFVKQYEQRFGHRVATLYGSVEVGVPIFEDLNQTLASGSCGRPLEGFEVRILGEKGERLPPNVPGHLVFKSTKPNSFFKGYFDDPESTKAVISGPWVRTGDLAQVDEASNVYFVGRVKDVIRRRGENVNASEVEEEFLQHPDVVTVAAYGIPSRLGGGTEQDVKVAVQKRRGSSLTERGLWDWAKEHMARFQVPSVIEFVDHLEQTPTGKIEKARLKVEGGQYFDMAGSKL